MAETRSENRTYRPRVELCRDDPHDGIIAERNELLNTVATLIDQHNIAEYVFWFISLLSSTGWCSGYHKRLPRRRSRVQIRPDASCPVTKLRIGTASAGGTHSLKLVQCFGAEWLRVTEKEISTSGNPFGELTWPCILYLVWWYLAGKRNLLLQIWAQIVPYLQLGREWMKQRSVLSTKLS